MNFINNRFIESRISVDGSPFNRLQVYMLVDRNDDVIADGRLEDSKNNMRKGRPCIVVQEGEIGRFYNETKLLVLPLTKVKYKKDKNGKK